MTSYPLSTSNAAAADESTPPDIATTTLSRCPVVIAFFAGVVVAPRTRRTTSSTAAPTLSISSSVFPAPIPIRIAHPASSADSPSARSTSEGASDPEVHAAPVDTLMPSRSSAAATNCPGAPAKPTFNVPGSRCAPSPLRRAPGIASNRASSRSRNAPTRAAAFARSAAARRAATPKPTMPLTFSVPARRSRS